jgi:hypothetical protein
VVRQQLIVEQAMTVHRDISTYDRRALTRACTALALAAFNKGTSPTDVMRQHWNDEQADRIVKAAINPWDSTMGWPAIPAYKILALVAPQSAAARLLDMGITLSLEGVHQIILPTILPAGRPTPAFIGEGAPAPVVQMTTTSNTLGPVKKILIITSFTSELQAVSADSAQKILSQALAYATEMSLDTALFSSNAATAVAPAGLLHGVTPITNAGASASPLGNIAHDIGSLAQAIANAGFNSDEMILVTNPAMAASARTQTGPHFDYSVLSSSVIPAGEVIGLVPSGLWTGYGDDIRIEASKETTLHYEDTTPLQLATGGVMASPTRNVFQQDLIALKLRARVAWAVLPGAIASLTGANW